VSEEHETFVCFKLTFIYVCLSNVKCLSILLFIESYKNPRTNLCVLSTVLFENAGTHVAQLYIKFEVKMLFVELYCQLNITCLN